MWHSKKNRKKMDHQINLSLFSIGFVSVFLIDSLYKNYYGIAKSTIKPRKSIKERQEDVISLSALAELTKSDNISLQEVN
jgi:hypothetical protein